MPSPTGGTKTKRAIIIATVVRRPSFELPGPVKITEMSRLHSSTLKTKTRGMLIEQLLSKGVFSQYMTYIDYLCKVKLQEQINGRMEKGCQLTIDKVST